jgi:hypothetical protein
MFSGIMLGEQLMWDFLFGIVFFGWLVGKLLAWKLSGKARENLKIENHQKDSEGKVPNETRKSFIISSINIELG